MIWSTLRAPAFDLLAPAGDRSHQGVVVAELRLVVLLHACGNLLQLQPTINRKTSSDRGKNGITSSRPRKATELGQ